MKKVLIGAMAAMVLGGLALSPVHAKQTESEPTVVPDVVNIEDPAGDANYLNGQGSTDDGDQVTPADAGSVSDILKVWFSHDAEVVRAHVLTEAPPPAAASAYFFRVIVDAAGDTNCLRFQVATTGPTDPAAAEARGTLRDLCGENDETYADGITVTIEETADGQGITTVIVPRSVHPALADNAVLGNPMAHVRNSIGAAVTAPQIDDTNAGTSYTISPAATEEPTGPPVKKGCKKGSPKAKKKGCKK